MIVLDKVTKKYDGKCVLKDLSLSLPETGIVRIMGKSGEGKTTLLHIIAGLVKPDSGTVRVEGSLSMVFQEDRLLKWDSVLENVRLAAGKTPCRRVLLLPGNPDWIISHPILYL